MPPRPIETTTAIPTTTAARVFQLTAGTNRLDDELFASF
jgi:hypothetical protein